MVERGGGASHGGTSSSSKTKTNNWPRVAVTMIEQDLDSESLAFKNDLLRLIPHSSLYDISNYCLRLSTKEIRAGIFRLPIRHNYGLPDRYRPVP